MGVAAAGPFSIRSPFNVTAAAPAPRRPAVTSQGPQAHGRHVAGRARRRGSGWTFFHTITIQCDRSRPGSHQPGAQDVERMDDAWPRARIGMAAAGRFSTRSPSNVTAAAPDRSRPRGHQPRTSSGMDDAWPRARMGMAAAGRFSTRSPSNVTAAAPATTSQDVERHGRCVTERGRAQAWWRLGLLHTHTDHHSMWPLGERHTDARTHHTHKKINPRIVFFIRHPPSFFFFKLESCPLGVTTRAMHCETTWAVALGRAPVTPPV